MKRLGASRTRLAVLLMVLVVVIVGIVAATTMVGSGRQTRTTTVFVVFANGSTSTSTSVTTITTSSWSPSCKSCGSPAWSQGAMAVTVHSDGSSRTISFVINDYYATDATLTNATVTALGSNIGYKDTMVINLQGISLGPGDAVYVTARTLPDLTVGDVVKVTVGTIQGTFWGV